ncbi:MAG: hypothetical protein QG635_129 [Bacteroidota bacterium]|nr:hypothetical protein [Bacteroidota bacterium]
MKPWKAELFLVLVTFIWGATFLFTKLGLRDCPPSVYIIIRFSIALLLSFIFFGRYLFKLQLDTIKHGIVLGLLFGGGFLLQTYGLKFTTVSKTAFITGITVIFTPMTYALVVRRKIHFWQKAGVLVAMPGLWLFTNPSFDNVNIGDILTLISTLFWAFYITYLDVFTKNKKEFHITAQLVMLQFLAAAPISVISFFVLEVQNFHFNLTTNLVVSLLFNGILASFIVTLIHTGTQKYTAPVKAALIFTLEPVIASIFAMIVLNEFLTLPEYIGASILFLGVITSEVGEYVIFYIKSKFK